MALTLNVECFQIFDVGGEECSVVKSGHDQGTVQQNLGQYTHAGKSINCIVIVMK